MYESWEDTDTLFITAVLRHALAFSQHEAGRGSVADGEPGSGLRLTGKVRSAGIGTREMINMETRTRLCPCIAQGMDVVYAWHHTSCKLSHSSHCSNFK